MGSFSTPIAAKELNSSELYRNMFDGGGEQTTIYSFT